MSLEQTPLGANGEDTVGRRDVINIAAVSFAGVGVAIVTLPLINSMNPSADVLAVSTTEVVLTNIAVGSATAAVFLGQPLFVRRLSPAEISQTNAVPLSILRDPETLADRTKAG